MNRITQKDLEAVVLRINTLTGMPVQPYGDNVDGRCNPQAGSYHLSYAYGGVSLHRMSLTIGCTGVSDIFGYHMPKRELYDRMQSFISGLYAAKGD